MIRVNEMFLSIQGEATFTGTPAVFVRLQGCKVGCAFCDTKHTWDVDPAALVKRDAMLAKTEDAPTYSELRPSDIVLTVGALARGARHVVITGGEPAEQDIEELVERLHRQGFRVQVETSGTAPLDVPAAFVTLSPKIGMGGGLDVRQDVIARADEIKHPTSTEKHFEALLEMLSLGLHRDGIPIWLQPLSMHPKATERCVEWCLQHGFRLSLQTHKYLGAR